MAADEFELFEESETERSIGRRLREVLEARSWWQDALVVRGRRCGSGSGRWLLRLRPRLLGRLPALRGADGLFARFSRSLRHTAEAVAVSARRRLELRLKRARAFVRGELAKRLERVPAVVEQAHAQLASFATGAGRRRAELARDRRARELQRKLEADSALQACADLHQGETSEDGHWLTAAAEHAPISLLAWRRDALCAQSGGGDERSAPPGDAAALMARARCNFIGLTSLVASRAAEFPDALEEWQAYLHSLQPYADNEGNLPPQLARLVASVFAPLLEAPRGLRSNNLYASAAEAR